jgi:hypothetical protein
MLFPCSNERTTAANVQYDIVRLRVQPLDNLFGQFWHKRGGLLIGLLHVLSEYRDSYGDDVSLTSEDQ